MTNTLEVVASSSGKKRPKIPHPMALFARSLMQCQRRLQNYRVKNIWSVVELRGVAFRLAPPYGGLLVLKSTKVGNSQIYRNIVLEGVCIPTGNDVTSYISGRQKIDDGSAES